MAGAGAGPEPAAPFHRHRSRQRSAPNSPRSAAIERSGALAVRGRRVSRAVRAARLLSRQRRARGRYPDGPGPVTNDRRELILAELGLLPLWVPRDRARPPSQAVTPTPENAQPLARVDDRQDGNARTLRSPW